MSILPINLDDLLQSHAVESIRLEFKRSWSDPTLEQILHTICGFANDFYNLNGGYIVIGVDAQEGLATLPPHGLDENLLEGMQKQIRGKCNMIEPAYQPLLAPEYYQGKHILVIWAPAGELRPYQAPKRITGGERGYYVRQGSETVEAKGEVLTQLIQLTAKVPFDDRRSLEATLDALSPALVRNFLSDIKSDLVASNIELADQELYRRLGLLVRINGHEVPKNVALLFFSHQPERFFRGARIDVVQFGDDAGGDLIEEKIFRGPIHLQLRQTLDYLDAFSTTLIKKLPNQAEVSRAVAFPYEAMEEAIVNAVYHRSYDGVQEPIKVYLYPDRMEIISYPGPVPGIELRHLQPGAMLPPVPNRNRRVGEFLKELRLAEGRGTGIPKIRRKMQENGSPAPNFEFDEARTYFRVVLPAHPRYIVVHALRESAHLWAIGERQRAIENLASALRRVTDSGILLAQMIEYLVSVGDLSGAEKVFAQIGSGATFTEAHLPYIAMAKAYLDRQNQEKASELLANVALPSRADDIIELAILIKRSGRFEDAHQIFANEYGLIKDNAKAVQEYAQTKIKLAESLPAQKNNIRRKLTREAVELLRRAIPLSEDNIRRAWCWYDLARALAWLGSPEAEVQTAYHRAIELLPNEPRFAESYERWQQRRQNL